MSALLALLVLGGAVWFVVSLAGGRAAGRREPVDSVSEFARAMSALDPAGAPRPVRPRPALRR